MYERFGSQSYPSFANWVRQADSTTFNSPRWQFWIGYPMRWKQYAYLGLLRKSR